MGSNTSTITLDEKIQRWENLVRVREQMIEIGINTENVMSELDSIFNPPGKFITANSQEKLAPALVIAEKEQDLETRNKDSPSPSPISKTLPTDQQSAAESEPVPTFPLQAFVTDRHHYVSRSPSLQFALTYNEETKPYSVFENGIAMPSASQVPQIILTHSWRVITERHGRQMPFYFKLSGDLVLDLKFSSDKVGSKLLQILQGVSNIEIKGGRDPVHNRVMEKHFAKRYRETCPEGLGGFDLPAPLRGKPTEFSGFKLERAD